MKLVISAAGNSLRFYKNFAHTPYVSSIVHVLCESK